MEMDGKSRKRVRGGGALDYDALMKKRTGSAPNPMDLAQDCQRRLRCCLAALRMENATELKELIDPTEQNLGEHVWAPVTAGCNCHVCGRTVDARQACRHRRSHMQSTKNSKRSVHTFLKWMSLVGPNFPVTDTMLQENFWKNLDPTCEYGVRKENGHAKRPGEPVCINPFHYNIVNTDRVLQMLLQELEPFFESVPGFQAAARIVQSHVGDPSLLFHAVITELRNAVDEGPWAISPLSYVPRRSEKEDCAAFLHFVAQTCPEDLSSLEVQAIITMTAITLRRSAIVIRC